MRQCAFILIPLLVGMAGAVAVSAQVTTKFRAERHRLEEAFDITGLTERQIFHNRDLNPFASPGMKIQKLLPGSSLAVTLRGNFPSGTTILSERDGVTSGSQLVTDLRTREGVVMGTLPYMSPDQLQGRAVDHRSDLFSLGAIVYGR